MKTSEIDIFDIDASNVLERQSSVQLDQNAFMVCTEGEVKLTLDGKDYKLQPGDMLIFPTLSQTTVRTFTPDFRGMGGAADFEWVLSALEAVSYTQRLLQIRNNPFVKLKPEQFERIQALVNSVRIRRSQPSVFRDRIVMSLIHTLLFELMDAYVENTPGDVPELSRADTVFMRFLSILTRDFREHREVSYYASCLNLTPRYFATIVRERSGMPPGGWIARFVIAEAKRLLSNSENSVKEVAVALSFPNQSFFGRYFRQNTGIAPGEYRRHKKR
ncbi:MAG: helix-turn-helix transcriptional regulator [Muribaculaceae bacterium]|nr:helix-turn-helix transcriptional regulator [Muribaculaceae bacterium]